MSMDSVYKRMVGDVAHDAADSGNPVKIGGKAANHGSLPTAVADADRVDARFDRYGNQFVVPGSTNIKALNVEYSSAQTNTVVVSAISGEAVRVWGGFVNLDYDAQAAITMGVGFASATTPTGAGCIFRSNGLPPGHFPLVNSPVVGASGEDLRITCTDPTSGYVNLVVYYDLISI